MSDLYFVTCSTTASSRMACFETTTWTLALNKMFNRNKIIIMMMNQILQHNFSVLGVTRPTKTTTRMSWCTKYNKINIDLLFVGKNLLNVKIFSCN